jgi:hypothetical protein
MARAFGLLVIIILLSLLKVGELVLITALGFDVLTTLKVSYDHGGVKFVLEAVGVFAFIIGQPIIFFALIIWGATKLGSAIAPRLTHLLTGLWPELGP